MKPVLFVMCFTLGVTLMIFSGYLPETASAGSNTQDREDAQSSLHENADWAKYRAPLRPAPVRWRETRPPDDVDAVDQEPPEPADAEDVYESPAVPVAENPESPPDDVAVPEKRHDDQLPPVPEGLDAGDEDEQESPAGEMSDADLRDLRNLAETAEHDAEMTGDEGGESPSAEDMAGDEPGEGDDEPAWDGLLADAGPDVAVWAGWGDVYLDASASMGEGLTYAWRQVGGPVELEIQNPTEANTSAVGLVPVGWAEQTFEFEVTVVDEAGKEDVDTVRYLVRSAPKLKIVPTAERRFELRDGYDLAHYEVWVTNLDSYESPFEVVSDTPLTFTRVSGDAYDLVAGESDDAYVYQIIVYAESGQETSWVELLVDTADRVPAIVQLGVSWVGQ